MAIRTGQTLNLPRENLAAAEKRLAQWKREDMRPKTALDRLVEDGPASLKYQPNLKDQPNYIQQDPTSYLAEDQYISDPKYTSARPGDLGRKLGIEQRARDAGYVDQEASAAEAENLIREQRELERQDPIGDARNEILMDPDQRNPMSENFAWKAHQERLHKLQENIDDWTPEQQQEADSLADDVATINTLLNDGFGQSIKRGDLLVKAFHSKINEQDVIAAGKQDYPGAEQDYAGTDIKMAYTEPAEAASISEAGEAQALADLRATLLYDDNYKTTEPVDAPTITPRNTDKTFIDYLMEANPKLRWNPLTLKALLFNQNKFNAGTLRTPSEMGLKLKSKNPYMMVDPNFIRIMNYVIEKHIFQQQFVPVEGEYEYELMESGVLRPAQLDLFDQDNPSSQEGPEQGMYSTKTSGSGKLGREIFKEWQREVNRSLGKPTDSYNLDSVTADEFEAIGAFAREVWQSVNPDLYTTDQTGDMIAYSLTAKGREALKQAALSAPDAFKTQEIPPTRISEAEVREATGSRITGEARRSRETTQVIKPETPHKKVEQGRNGMEHFGHQVASKRTKLFYQVGLQSMIDAKSQTDLTALGDFVKLGPEKMLNFKGEFEKKVAQRIKRSQYMIDEATARDEVMKEYDPAYEMDKQFTRFIETLNTLARYSDGLWKLKFAHQGLTSRMHVIQTRFNPQGNPWIRFATGGATPTIFSPKNNSEENNVFKELMAMMFIPGGKKATPEKRVEMFNKELSRIDQPDSILATVAAEGQTVEESLMDNDTYKNTTELLKNIGLAVNPQQQQKQMFNPETNQYETATSTADYIKIPEELVQTPRINIPDSLLARTRDKTGASEDIDGLHKVEGAMELKRYLDALKNGTQFSTDINVEFDGKTHGISSYLASLGNLKAAYRTGITREAGAVNNLGEVPVAQLAGVEGQVFTFAKFNIIDEGTVGDIENFDGAYYDKQENTIVIAVDDIRKRWEKEEWANPRKLADGSRPESLMKSYSAATGKKWSSSIFRKSEAGFQEFLEFIKFQQSVYARQVADPTLEIKKQADGVTPAETLGVYESRINEIAFKEFEKHRKILSQADITKAEGDIRDAVGLYMLTNGREYAANGFHQNDANTERLYRILELAVNDKEFFLKQPIMTLSYGRLIKNLDEEVINTIKAGKNVYRRAGLSSGIADIIAEIEASGEVDLEVPHPTRYGKTKKYRDVEHVVMEFLHNIMADGIDSELHPGVQAVGQALRATNVVAMLSNGIMSMDNALGFPNYIGAKETRAKIDPNTEQQIKSDITMVTSRTNPQTGKKGVTTRGIGMVEGVASGSALRSGQLAGWGRGRIIPAIIQAMDGAWMNMTFRGKSFEKIKDGYALPIFDAVKTDIKTAAAVRREANSNWWNVVKNYKPWRSLFIDWTDKQIGKYEKELQTQIDNGNTPINFAEVSNSLRPYFQHGHFSTFIRDPLDPSGLKPATAEEERIIIGNKAKKQLEEFKPYYLLLHANKSDTDKQIRIGDLHLSTLAQLFEDTMPFRPKNEGERISDYDQEKSKRAYLAARWVVRGPILNQMLQAQTKSKAKGDPFWWRGAEPLANITPSQMRSMFRRIIRVLRVKDIPDSMMETDVKINDKGQVNISNIYKPQMNEAMVKSIEGSGAEYFKRLPANVEDNLGQVDMG